MSFLFFVFLLTIDQMNTSMCKKVNRSDKPTDIHRSLHSALKSFIVSLFQFYGLELYSFCFSLTALINFVSRLQLIFFFFLVEKQVFAAYILYSSLFIWILISFHVEVTVQTNSKCHRVNKTREGTM